MRLCARAGEALATTRERPAKAARASFDIPSKIQRCAGKERSSFLSHAHGREVGVGCVRLFSSMPTTEQLTKEVDGVLWRRWVPGGRRCATTGTDGGVELVLVMQGTVPGRDIPRARRD